MNNNGGLQVGIADDQAKDFDFEKTEMKYDSTGMFHWGPAKSLEECILVSWWCGRIPFNACYTRDSLCCFKFCNYYDYCVLCGI
jgi:hypothetical protein